MICSDKWLLALVLLLGAAACNTQGKPSTGPRLDAVSPSIAFVDEETQLVLSGEAFAPKATLQWGGGTGDVTASTAFEVSIGTRVLTGVTWKDSRTLAVTLPAGFPIGTHAVTLVDPYGVSATLPEALEVRVRKGAVLAATLTTDSSAIRVLKEVVVHLDVTNTGDSAADALGALQLAPSGTGEVTALGVSAGKTRLAPGETARFELKWVSMKIGTVVLSAEVRGVDARTGTAVRAGPLSTGVIQIVPPPDIDSTLIAAQKIVSRGQVIELRLEASNVGLVGVKDLLPTAVPSPIDRVDLKTAPLARDLAIGTTQMFSFFFDTLTTGEVAFRADALGVDAFTGATVAMTPAFETVTIVNPAKLTLALAPSAARLDVGQRFTLTATVTNSGDAKALAVTPSLAISGTGGLTLVSAPVPAVVGAAPVDFVWEYDTAAAGSLQLTVGAIGIDEYSLATVSAPAAVVGLVIAARAALTATFTTPLRVNTGQSFAWSLEVANSGDSAALGVTPGTIGASSGAADGGPSPTSHDIPGGASRSFSFAHIAGGAGTLSFQASPAGTDAVDGLAVSAPLATSAVIQVERPAVLAGVLGLPSGLSPLSPFAATLVVTNTGEAVALAVTPSALAITGNATLVSGPSPASAVLAGDGGVTFTWQLLAGASGTVQVSAEATGTDANDGAALTTGLLTSNVANALEVTAIATDPFADGTPFSYIFSYAGKVWLGPRASGLGALAMNPDGTGAVAHDFSFVKDTSGGQTHRNSQAGPFPSIGTSSCVLNTLACGPDNENGRGVFFSGTFGGAEWLGVAGARVGGQLDYIYLSSDTDPTIDFRYVDLANGLGGNTQGTSAAHFFNDRLYLGFPDTGGSRPYLLALLAPPPSPGVNSTLGTSPNAGVNLLQMDGDQLPAIGASSTPTLIIDAITDFNDRLYLANNGGIVRSTTNLPRGPGVAAGDWALSTPNAAAYTGKNPVNTNKVAELLPSDRAFPAMAVYQGRLYAARNTTTGPQLWVCTPGADTFCAPSEWSQVAANSTGDALLSQFNSNSNQSIGLLAATATTLFVGFNNPMGLQLFKTTAAAPTSRADFTGAAGCVAGNAGCEGLGGNGLGATMINRQIFDSRALTFGSASWLYLVTGNGTSGVRVWRIGG